MPKIWMLIILLFTCSGPSEALSVTHRIQGLHSWTDLIEFANLRGSDREYVLKKLRTDNTLAPFPRIRWNDNTSIISVDHEKFEFRIERGYTTLLWRRRMAMFSPHANPREKLEIATHALLGSKDFHAGGSIPLFIFKIALFQLPLVQDKAKAAGFFRSEAYAAILAALGLEPLPQIKRLSQTELALENIARVRCSEFETPKRLSYADFLEPAYSSNALNDAYEFCKIRKSQDTNCAADAQSAVLDRITHAHAWRLRAAPDGSLFRVKLKKSDKGEVSEDSQSACAEPFCKELAAKLNAFCANPTSQANQEIEAKRVNTERRLAGLPFIDRLRLAPPRSGQQLFGPKTDGSAVIQ